MKRKVFVVVRIDNFENTSPEIWQHLVRVKSVHPTFEDAENETERLNALGLSSYFVQPANWVEHHRPSVLTQTMSKPQEKSDFLGGWAVGPIGLSDQHSLEQKIARLMPENDFLLITWIGCTAEFKISSAVWQNLTLWEEVAFDFSLGAVKNQAELRDGVPVGATTFLVIRSTELNIEIHTSNIHQGVEQLTTCLNKRSPTGAPTEICLGRYVSNGQITIRFPRALIRLLHAHNVSIVGGSVADCLTKIRKQ